MNEALYKIYLQRCSKPDHPDVKGHMGFLAGLAAGCNTVLELGVRTGNSTAALLLGCPNTISVDIKECRTAQNVFKKAGCNEWRFVCEDSLKLGPTPCDMLFIDSKHEKDHLFKELVRHAPYTSRWIVIHDTEKFPELWGAIRTFFATREGKAWDVKFNFTHCNGLVVLERWLAA